MYLLPSHSLPLREHVASGLAERGWGFLYYIATASSFSQELAATPDQQNDIKSCHARLLHWVTITHTQRDRELTNPPAPVHSVWRSTLILTFASCYIMWGKLAQPPSSLPSSPCPGRAPC